MQLRLHAFDLPLAHTFTISRESITSQPTLIVELSQDGISGYGEATSNKYYGFTIERMARDLAAMQPQLKRDARRSGGAMVADASRLLSDDPFALCALDQAAHDLWGKLRGQPVWKLWGLSTEKDPAVELHDRHRHNRDDGRENGRVSPAGRSTRSSSATDRDLEIVRELRKHTDATFRVDANCGWTADQAIAYAPELKKLGVEFIEQPLPADAWDDMRRVGARVRPADHRRRKLHSRSDVAKVP